MEGKEEKEEKEEEEVVKLVKERNLDVLGVCKVRLSGHERRTLFDNYEILLKGRDLERRCKAAIILIQQMVNRVEDVRYKNERIIISGFQVGREESFCNPVIYFIVW